MEEIREMSVELISPPEKLTWENIQNKFIKNSANSRRMYSASTGIIAGNIWRFSFSGKFPKIF